MSCISPFSLAENKEGRTAYCMARICNKVWKKGKEEDMNKLTIVEGDRGLDTTRIREGRRR